VTTGTAARTALGAVLALDCFAGADVAAITGDVTAFTALAVTLPEGLATGVFFEADRAATGSDCLSSFIVAGLVLFDLLLDLALASAFPTEGADVFADFFIAFAIESTAK
jgi:hypothetical protein